jgi:cytochrome d ubiquinol oxidase subunit I
MMDLDPVLLARLQFAFTVTFHIIFPSFTIGLSAWLATLGAMWLRTGQERYVLLMRFWVKIFAVSFAMGVVSGIVLSYEFGTNWSRFSVAVGNVVAPLIGYEVLTAFSWRPLSSACCCSASAGCPAGSTCCLRQS